MPQPMLGYLDQLDEFPTYKGGHTCLYGGYVYEFCPGHHLQNHWGWVPQHRLIGEDIAGRQLVQSADSKVRECVHHRDENRTNNALTNLEIMTFSVHRSHHMTERYRKLHEQLTEIQVSKALECGNIKRAAKACGVDHNTLRSRFPHLLEPYKRKSPLRIDKIAPEMLAEIRRLAADPNVSMEDCWEQTLGSYKTLINLCRKLGIVWVRKSKKGMLMRTNRGKPTLRALALRAAGIEPEYAKAARAGRRRSASRLPSAGPEKSFERRAAPQG